MLSYERLWCYNIILVLVVVDVFVVAAVAFAVVFEFDQQITVHFKQIKLAITFYIFFKIEKVKGNLGQRPATMLVVLKSYYDTSPQGAPLECVSLQWRAYSFSSLFILDVTT